MHCLFLNLREQTLLKQLISRALSATTKSADITSKHQNLDKAKVIVHRREPV